MEDAQFENVNLSQLRAERVWRGSPSIAGSATASDFLTAAASEQASSSHAAFVTASIELSKCHWSECVEADGDYTDDEIAKDNLKVFQSLQRHPTWGSFFITFGYDTEIAYRSGEMEMGEQFAEGGQAELFHAHITWRNPETYNEYCEKEEFEKEEFEWVLKVFKKGTLLRELQSQWPQGYLKWWADQIERERLKYPLGLRWHCDVKYGTLMRDGRFAFVMLRESGDLRSKINQKLLKCGDDSAPFSENEGEEICYRIARGMDWLHKQNVVHRDVKASNILVNEGICLVADFECSVGVVGTGLWRAPEILQACKDRTVNQRPELFTKASDVYSFGMTCNEVLTGKYPFQDEDVRVSDVIAGKQPHVPGFVHATHKNLLRWCWRLDPASRPTFDEILALLEGSSKSPFVQKRKLERMRGDEGGHALLECTNPSHTLGLVECARNEDGGSYVCKLCLKVGDGQVYECSSCGDFDLHPECARVPTKLVSFLHPHELDIVGPYNHRQYSICDGCQENLVGCEWVYRCKARGCDFDLHARCGKYAATLFHESHSKHELLLKFDLGEVQFVTKCHGCKTRIRARELVYTCKECNFFMHPRCALGKPFRS